MGSTLKDKAAGEGLEAANQSIIYAQWENDPFTSFEVDTQEDIVDNLEAFIRLNRLGRFSEACAFFEKTLRPHVKQFPVFIEYADLLLEQGDLSSLSEFLSSAPTNAFSAEENVLIGLLQALADIYISAAWDSGWILARQAWSFLESQSLDNEELPSDIQIHITETYLTIIALILKRSDLKVKPSEPQGFPWIVTGDTLVAKCAPFLKWHDTLQTHGLRWEGYKILQLLLPFLNTEIVLDVAPPRLLSNIILSVGSVKSDESQLLTVLTIVNDIIRNALAFFPRQTAADKSGILGFVTPYYDLATTVIGIVFGSDPTASQGRLVIQWILAKEQIKVLQYPLTIDLNKMQPLLSELSIEAGALGDIRLQAELLLAVCWVDENIRQNSWPDLYWDITRLAAPVYPSIVLPLDTSRNMLKALLTKFSSDWAKTATAGEVWNLILVPASDHERYLLLESLTKIVSGPSALTSEILPALSLTAKVMSQSLSGNPHIDNDDKAIFHSAARADATPLLASEFATYKRIYEILSKRNGEGKTILDYAVENNHEVVIASILDLEPGVHVTRETLHLVAEYTNMSSLRKMAEQQPQQIDASLVRKMIQRGQADISRTLIEVSQVEASEMDEWEQLLPLAVRKRQLSVVDILVSKFPTSPVRVDGSGHYPLWYNKPLAPSEDTEDLKSPKRSVELDREVEQKIRDMIAPIIIAHLPLSEAKIALGDDAKELCLDLRIYQNSPKALSDFIDSNIPPVEMSSLGLTFESVLKYVYIPNLEDVNLRKEDLEKLQQIRREADRKSNRVSSILEWLSQQKRVRKIIQLTVTESIIYPLDEDEIVENVEKFDVEILDWRICDLSIDCILNAAPHVKEIFLYSARWVSICQWTSSEGAVVLPKLEVLHIMIFNSTLSEALADKYLRRAKERMARLLKSSSRVLRLDIRLSEDKVKSQTPIEATRLGLFLQGYSSLQTSSLVSSLPSKTQSKIAILGAGLHQTLPAWKEVSQKYAGNVTESSFVNNRFGMGTQWALSTSSHVTYFASVVCQLDPFCELFIGKVMDNPDTFSISQLVSAIDWAVKLGVDIAVIDIELPEPTDQISVTRLKACIIHAQSRGMTFFAGAEADSWWFYDRTSDGLITVTNWASEKKSKARISCNSSGIVLPGLDSKSATAMKPESVAIALATGVASLITAARRLAQYRPVSGNVSRRHSRDELVDILVRKMDGSSCLEPWRWFGEEPLYTVEGLQSRLEKMGLIKDTYSVKEKDSVIPISSSYKK